MVFSVYSCFRHDITEILLKVALSTISQIQELYLLSVSSSLVTFFAEYVNVAVRIKDKDWFARSQCLLIVDWLGVLKVVSSFTKIQFRMFL